MRSSVRPAFPATLSTTDAPTLPPSPPDERDRLGGDPIVHHLLKTQVRLQLRVGQHATERPLTAKDLGRERGERRARERCGDRVRERAVITDGPR